MLVTFCSKKIYMFDKPIILQYLILFNFFSYSNNMRKKYLWSHKIYRDWRFACNRCALGDPSLRHIADIMELDNEELNFALSRFILEIRKKSGANYPAETLYEIVVCLQLHMAMKGTHVKLLDEVYCNQIHNTSDNRMKELSRLGCV